MRRTLSTLIKPIRTLIKPYLVTYRWKFLLTRKIMTLKKDLTTSLAKTAPCWSWPANFDRLIFLTRLSNSLVNCTIYCFSITLPLITNEVFCSKTTSSGPLSTSTFQDLVCCVKRSISLYRPNSLTDCHEILGRDVVQQPNFGVFTISWKWWRLF